MRDQADTLRKLMRGRENTSGTGALSSARIFTVASGKGGVGKTSLVANLGVSLARKGIRTLLVDADFGLANLDILLGVQSSATVEQVLQGRASVRDAVIGVEANLWLLPASTGFSSAREWAPESRVELAQIFDSFPWEMDVVLVDAGAGVGETVLSLHSPLQESVVVVTPEPTSFTDAYTLIKLLRRHSGVHRVSVLVNQVTDASRARDVFRKLNDVATQFLDVQLEYLGHVPRDEKFVQAVVKRKTLLDLDDGGAALPCIELLSRRISGGMMSTSGQVLGGLQAGRRMTPQGNSATFWRTLLGEVKA